MNKPNGATELNGITEHDFRDYIEYQDKADVMAESLKEESY